MALKTWNTSSPAADEYYLGLLPVGTTTKRPYLKRTSYNTDSWTPICMVSQGPFYLVVGADSPVVTLDDYISAANADGTRFTGTGPGPMAHVAKLTLDNSMDITIQYIPTKGGGDIATKISRPVRAARPVGNGWSG